MLSSPLLCAHFSGHRGAQSLGQSRPRGRVARSYHIDLAMHCKRLQDGIRLASAAAIMHDPLRKE